MHGRGGGSGLPARGGAPDLPIPRPSALDKAQNSLDMINNVFNYLFMGFRNILELKINRAALSQIHPTKRVKGIRNQRCGFNPKGLQDGHTTEG